MSKPDANGDVQFEMPNASKGRVKICAGWFAMVVKKYNRAQADQGADTP